MAIALYATKVAVAAKCERICNKICYNQRMESCIYIQSISKKGFVGIG